jgi:acyl transferase domain-containing protein
VTELRDRIACVADMVRESAFVELGDLAASLQRGLTSRPARAAVVITSADQLSELLARPTAMLDGGVLTGWI